MSFWQHSSRGRRAFLADLQRFGISIGDVDFADEPIQLVDAYRHLRIEYDSNGSADDAWLEAQIPAAREYCEIELGRSLAARTITRTTNKFPTISVDGYVGPSIELPLGPVRSITSVTYLRYQTDSNGDQVLDSNGDSVTETATLAASTYDLDTYVTPNRLVLAYGQSWPTSLDAVNSVRVTYVTGYMGAPDSNDHPVLPKTARSAILLMLGHLYENREAVAGVGLIEIPLGVTALLALVPNRERLGMA